MKKAIFAGSFDPFTKGHKNIIDRALNSIADEITVVIGSNKAKKCMFSLDERMAAVESAYKGNSRVSVVYWDGLITDYANANGIDFLIRGVRSIKDFEYERDMAEVNHMLTGIETVLLFSAPEYASVSSSVVRELISFNKNVEPFLP